MTVWALSYFGKMTYRTLDLGGSKPIALEEVGSLLPLRYIAETNTASLFIPNYLTALWSSGIY